MYKMNKSGKRAIAITLSLAVVLLLGMNLMLVPALAEGESFDEAEICLLQCECENEAELERIFVETEMLFNEQEDSEDTTYTSTASAYESYLTVQSNNWSVSNATALNDALRRAASGAGYADAFKLLADEAGLESIVVTGYLEGFLPHAWNRVNINGQWHTVDVTNNANDYLYNIFLHLPDHAARIVLVEDDRFVLSEFVHRYRSTSLDDEYFYSTGRFFDVDSVASELAERVAENGNATLRTDFNLDDDTFLDIIQEVVYLLGMDMIYGFHWFGAIFVTDGS